MINSEQHSQFPQEPVRGEIVVELTDHDWTHVAAVRALCDSELRSNPAINGGEIRIVRGDFTCITGPELIGTELLIAIRQICRAGS